MMRILMSSMFAMAVMLSGGFAMTVYSPVAEAKGYSSSSFRSSSSFSRSSSRSSWSSSSSKSSKGLFSSSSSKRTATKAPTTPSAQKQSFKRAPVDTKKRVVSSPQSIAKQRAHFKRKPVVPTTTSSKAPTRQVYAQKYGSSPLYRKATASNRSTYSARRDRYYNNYSVPQYVYYGSPSFGMWDAMFLYFILDNVNNSSQFAYHHQNDPDYLAWRAQANETAKTNEELARQLREMDAAAAKVSGPIKTDFIPDGTDPDIALSQEVLAASKPVLKLCTGERKGAYALIGAATNSVVKETDVQIVLTSGSRENLEKIEAGTCDAALVQRDSYWNFVEETQKERLNFERVGSVAKESLMMFCHEDGPSSIDEVLEQKATVNVLKNSGAAETWKNITIEDRAYAKLNVNETETFDESVLNVRQNRNQCALYVGVPGLVPHINQIERDSKAMNLVMVDFRNDELAATTDPAKQKVYSQTEVDYNVYPNLLRQAGTFFGSGDLWTMQTDTDFIVSLDWKGKHKHAFYAVANGTAALPAKLKQMGAR